MGVSVAQAAASAGGASAASVTLELPFATGGAKTITWPKHGAAASDASGTSSGAPLLTEPEQVPTRPLADDLPRWAASSHRRSRGRC